LLAGLATLDSYSMGIPAGLLVDWYNTNDGVMEGIRVGLAGMAVIMAGVH